MSQFYVTNLSIISDSNVLHNEFFLLMNKEFIQLRLTTAGVSGFVTSCFVCRLQDCFLVNRVFMGDSCCFRKILGLHSLSYALPLR